LNGIFLWFILSGFYHFGTNEPVPANTESPHHTVSVKFKSRTIVIKVRLPRISDKHINLWPTNSEFYLDTFKSTKKYLLKFPYPQNIQVNADQADVKFMGEYLTVSFPITQIRDNFNDKIIRKKGYKPEGSEEKPKKKKKPTTVSDKNAMLSLVDSISDVEDKKIQQKLQKERAKTKFFEEKEKKNAAKKRKREELKSKSLKEIKQTQKGKQQPQKKNSKSKQKKAKK